MPCLDCLIWHAAFLCCVDRFCRAVCCATPCPCPCQLQKPIHVTKILINSKEAKNNNNKQERHAGSSDLISGAAQEREQHDLIATPATTRAPSNSVIMQLRQSWSHCRQQQHCLWQQHQQPQRVPQRCASRTTAPQRVSVAAVHAAAAPAAASAFGSTSAIGAVAGSSKCLELSGIQGKAVGALLAAMCGNALGAQVEPEKVR